MRGNAPQSINRQIRLTKLIQKGCKNSTKTQQQMEKSGNIQLQKGLCQIEAKKGRSIEIEAIETQ